MTIDIRVRNLEDTLYAINLFIDKHISYINTRKVRKYLNVDSSNRSKINFIGRSLQFLQKKGILEEVHRSKTIHYKLLRKEKIDIQEFIEQMEIHTSSTKKKLFLKN